MARKGQIAVLLAFVLAAIALFVLMNVDLFTATREKMRLENAGDAAAIAAARRQGELLNELGRLNLSHIRAAANNKTSECERIVLEQRRLALLGPIDALRQASEVARRNGMEQREEFAKILREHARDVRLAYSGGGSGGDPYPEPFPDAWNEYASAIESVCAGGLCAGPDNIRFHDSVSSHLLIDKAFYQAVAGMDWCWFHFRAPALLDSYSTYRDWSPLEQRRDNPLDNSEIFSLLVTANQTGLLGLLGYEALKRLAGGVAGADFPATPEEAAETLLADPEQTWFFFDPYGWRTWFDGKSLANDEDRVEFPLGGEVRSEYNVHGCAAVLRCEGVIDPVAAADTVTTWSAAAKPFGFLENEEEARVPANAMAGLVLPCFEGARLVPVDAVDGADLTTADYGWVEHVRKHLPRYMEVGPVGAGGCWYCMQLQTWERPSFRYAGSVWLKSNSGSCRRSVSGGGGGHGGTSRGH